MLKNVIAQLKQNSGMMTQFMNGNVALAGANVNQQRAVFDIFKGQETAKDQVRAGSDFWRC
ncbi:competence pheromone ComX [Paenibacillus kobensis]|uniref:competence pheromone ComX n=1 Tax=Paenibacillus kobensis TaxID=59841 RepID=UPI000FDC3C3E|nr:competence pheromone ComX [Paenibacillus kobensis]